MTSKAPKEIWVNWPQENGTGLAFSKPTNHRQSYTLTTHAKAMVAAAYEDAADTCFAPKWKPKCSTDWVQARTAGTIRARTADDAQAALDALLKAEREAGRVEALKEAFEAIADYPRVAPEEHEWVYYDEQIEYSQRCILALIEKETGHE